MIVTPTSAANKCDGSGSAPFMLSIENLKADFSPQQDFLNIRMKFALVALLIGSLIAAATAASTAQKRQKLCDFIHCPIPDNPLDAVIGRSDGAVASSLSTGAIGLCAVLFYGAKLLLL